LREFQDELLQKDGFGLGRGVGRGGRGGGVAALSLSAPAFFGHEVGGDPEEEGLGMADLAACLVGGDAEVGFLDDVVDACDAQMAETG